MDFGALNELSGDGMDTKMDVEDERKAGLCVGTGEAVMHGGATFKEAMLVDLRR